MNNVVGADLRDAQLLIDGRWRPGRSGHWRQVLDPATRRRCGSIAIADSSDVEKAIESSLRAGREWRATSRELRSRVIADAAQRLRAAIPEVSRAFTQQQGKPLHEATAELQRSVQTLEWIANAALTDLTRDYPSTLGRRYTLPEPLGPVAAFVPWNYPAVLAARKIGYALAAGCPVILKSAEEVPATAVAIAEAIRATDAPGGLVNVLFGDPPAISAQLISSGRIRKVSFTGSTAVGKEIAALAAGSLVQCTLELGGHTPVLVLEDADIESTVRALVEFKFECAGQSCNAPSRVFIHEAIFARFTEALASRMGELRLGQGIVAETTMGPLQHARRLDAVRALVADAVAGGATAVTGDSQDVPAEGFFFAPTLLTHVAASARIRSEEPFGPIIVADSFATSAEAIERANQSSFGLAGYCFSGQPERALELARGLDVGYVGINGFAGIPFDAPTGGVRDSGYGIEGGLPGIEDFTHGKLIAEFKLR
jgi:succinate-semialdehyde dehydrogenase/glutarate-semialdehyde dehydrogenase